MVIDSCQGPDDDDDARRIGSLKHIASDFLRLRPNIARRLLGCCVGVVVVVVEWG